MNKGDHMIKLMHIGDVHLDTPFYSRTAPLRQQLREGLRTAFQRVIERCIQEQVHGLLIAGDLFDQRQLSFQTEQLLIRSFERLKAHHIQVFYCTGNHDPGIGSGRIQSIPWPENVVVFKEDQVQVVDLLDHQGLPLGKVVGVGHKTHRESRNLIKDFPVKSGELPWIGLAHTLVTNGIGADLHDRYLPCEKKDLEEKGYDYWALGHVHQMQQVSTTQAIYYSGNLQGRHPRETGEKGGLLITLAPYQPPQVQPIPFAPLRWETLRIDTLARVTHYGELREVLHQTIGPWLDQEGLIPQEVLLRLSLEGRCPLKEALQQGENIAQLEADLTYDFAFVDVEIRTEALKSSLNVDPLQLAQGDHVLKRVLELIKNLKENPQGWEGLKDLPLLHPDMHHPQRQRAYLLQLLEGLEEEALERLAGDIHEN